jgi:hypothetical protein
MKNSLITAILFFSFLVGSFAQEHAFDCKTRTFFLKHNQNGNQVVGVLDTNNASVAVFSSTPIEHNVLAFNPVDNFLYAVGQSNGRVYRIDSTGNVIDLGLINGFSSTFQMSAGDFDTNGVLYFAGQNGDPNIYGVDVSSNPPQLVSQVGKSYSNQSGTPQIFDFALNTENNLFYGVETFTGLLYQINPATGVFTTVSNQPSGIYDLAAAAMDVSNDMLYGYGRYSQLEAEYLFRCNISTGVCTEIAVGDSYRKVDGCACTGNPCSENQRISVVEAPNGTLEVTSSLSIQTTTFQWFDCETGLILEGENDNSIVVPSGSSYGLITTQRNGLCVDSSACFNGPLGLRNIHAGGDFVIYPNPNDGRFRIIMDESKATKSILVLNSMGDVVWSSDNQGEIDLSLELQVSPGVYSLIVEYHDGSAASSRRLVVQE